MGIVLLLLFFIAIGVLFWLFYIQNQLRELHEQNNKLESTLRRLQQDISANKSIGTKSGIITIETDKQPEQPVVPIRPAAPIVPFAHPIADQYDSGIRKRFEDSGFITGTRTTAEWSDVQDVSSKTVNHKSESDGTWSLELFIGQKLFGWIAVVGFIVAAALFIQYAVTMGWVTNVIKVLGIAVFALASLLALATWAYQRFKPER